MKRSYSSNKRNIIKYILVIFIFILIFNLSSCFNSKYSKVDAEIYIEKKGGVDIENIEVNVKYAYKVYGVEKETPTLVLGDDGYIYTLMSFASTTVYQRDDEWEVKDNFLIIGKEEYFIFDDWKYILSKSNKVLYERV